MQTTNSLNQEKKKRIFVISIAILTGILLILIAIVFWLNLTDNVRIDVYTNIAEYNNYIGEGAKENFQLKLGMDESVFPKEITEDMDVKDYKMVYYNPWDPQYIGYLVVSYDENAYVQEMERLAAYKSTEYLGNYGVTGFLDKYTLVAMYADEYAGFVYALSDNKDTIIYVELIFCNYFLDLDYKEYIPNEYLPSGFDATIDNVYRKMMLSVE